MAFGGMLRGVYGRAESPYNPKYLAAAFASGSSNGSGVSTTASFAAFGMGEETVSSGRSPASNNGLVAYTPSRGLISIRGNWPLYPTCDTVVPHTRTMDDLFEILDVLTNEDRNTTGDFWRDQPFMNIPKSWRDRPSLFSSITETGFLNGRRIAVPAMYLGTCKYESSVYTSEAVESLFLEAKCDLEACGATVEVCSDFPVLRLYEDPSSKWPLDYDCSMRLPDDWNSSERGTLIAHSWDDFLRVNDDPKYPSLSAADSSKMFPQLPDNDPQAMFSEVANVVQWSKLASFVENNTTVTIDGKCRMYSIPDLEKAVNALEYMRKKLFEDWLTQNNFDFVVFPAAGDVGYAEADVDVDLARHTWRNGVKYSNGNRALRHLGIPSMTITMGMIPDKQMPMGLTFLGRAYDDTAILKAGYEYEQKSRRRICPALTPPIQSDIFHDQAVDPEGARPTLEVTSCSVTRAQDRKIRVSLEGSLDCHQTAAETPNDMHLDIYVDGVRLEDTEVSIPDPNLSSGGNIFSFSASRSTSPPPEQDDRNRVVGKIARDSIMIIVLARVGDKGRPSGWLRLIHADDIVS